jgi:hypothetical protein
MSIYLAHCITQKNHFFTSAQPLGSRSPVLVHMHVHSTNLISHCITHESHLEFLINSSTQKRLIHHLYFYSHEYAPNTLGFHTFTCAQPHARPTLQITFLTVLHMRVIWSSSQLSVWRRSSLRSSSVPDRNHTPSSGAFSQVCKLENISHNCNDPHLTGL